MNEIVGSGRFPSRSQPGKVWEAKLFADGASHCNCPGWSKHHHCRHIDALQPEPRKTKKNAHS